MILKLYKYNTTSKSVVNMFIISNYPKKKHYLFNPKRGTKQEINLGKVHKIELGLT
jgi:hypothetical protein